jgi:hypothetical protein
MVRVPHRRISSAVAGMARLHQASAAGTIAPTTRAARATGRVRVASARAVRTRSAPVRAGERIHGRELAAPMYR